MNESQVVSSGVGNPKLQILLDDLSSRFIINCPEEELASFERICFQIEQAHWFYEDFYREKDPKLPSFSLKVFARLMFEQCPLLRPYLQKTTIDNIFESFRHYKTQVPVCGAILLNPQLDKCLLVKGWHSRSSWGFPKGKINKEEPEIECAKREVLEETGYIIPTGEINEEDFIAFSNGEQKIKLYIVTNVPEDTNFSPKTRKEISKIKWHLIAELPSYNKNKNTGERTSSKNFFMVIPVVQKLKHWVRQKKKGGGKKRSASLTLKKGLASNSSQKTILLRKDPQQPEQPNKLKIVSIVTNKERKQNEQHEYKAKPQQPQQQQQHQPQQSKPTTGGQPSASLAGTGETPTRVKKEAGAAFKEFRFNYDEILACLPPPMDSRSN